jgi:hypothetical protein
MPASKSAAGVVGDSIEREYGRSEGGGVSEKMDVREAQEVFQKSAEGVDFRTVSW